MSGLIAHIATTAKPEERNLNKVRSLLYADDLDYTLAVILDKHETKCRLARDEFVAYLSHPSDRTRPSVRSTASTYLKALGSDAVAATLEKSSFRLRDVVDGKPLSIYLVIPPEKLESHRALLRLWVGTLLTAVTSRRRIPRTRTLFLLDECAQLGMLSAFRQAVTLMRGYGLQIWSFWQDLGQLRQLYPQDWGTIVNNSAVLQAFGLSNAMMAREWADLFGEEVEQIRALGSEEAALFVQHSGYRKCRRINYLRDRLFAGMFDANERFALLSSMNAVPAIT
jgi:type IV secretion system protein VirD4